MRNDEKIRQLRILISDYENESEELSRMCDLWENHDDPCSDPGLQYEQERKVNAIYESIKSFSLTL